MKRSFLLLLFFFSAFQSFSQLLIQSDTKGLYVTHVVAPKENFYSVGRLYAISPKEIAAINSLDMSKGLVVGQSIRIPLTAANFSQASTAKGKAVYYTVGAKEGLYRVSQKTGKALMADLRKWNHLTSDAISTGQKLVVGYLAGRTGTNPVVQTIPNTTPPKPTGTPVKIDGDPVVPTEVVKDTATGIANTDSKPEKKVENVTPPPPSATPVRTALNDGSGGYFKKQFDQQVKTANANKQLLANSSIFKTSSGWQDTKYYALLDGVEPGTIIKVTNSLNSKVIYAKVLGGMTNIRQNQGFELRISNAAASVLEIANTDKFAVTVNY